MKKSQYDDVMTTKNRADIPREAYNIAKALGLTDYADESGVIDAVLIGSPIPGCGEKWECIMRAHERRLYIPAPIGAVGPWFPYHFASHAQDSAFEGYMKERTTTHLGRNAYLLFYGLFSRFQEHTRDKILKIKLPGSMLLTFAVDHAERKMSLVSKEKIKSQVSMRQEVEVMPILNDVLLP